MKGVLVKGAKPDTGKRSSKEPPQRQRSIAALLFLFRAICIPFTETNFSNRDPWVVTEEVCDDYGLIGLILFWHSRWLHLQL